jgi:plastocyanin
LNGIRRSGAWNSNTRRRVRGCPVAAPSHVQALRTPVILKGQGTAVVFNDVGAYDDICGLHPNMKGKVELTK